MPYCILCKMQRVTTLHYRNFLHYRENFCPKGILERSGLSGIETIALESASKTVLPFAAASDPSAARGELRIALGRIISIGFLFIDHPGS
jgi:hypothetical protein